MPDFPVIDAHLHIWDPGRLRYPWLDAIPALNRPFGLEEFDRARGPVAVEAMVFLQCEARFDQFPDEARLVAREARRDPRIKAMVPWAPLEKGAAVEADLEALLALGPVRGVRRIIQFEPDIDFCLRPDFIEGVRRLAAFGLSFDICVDHRQMANVVKLAASCPDVPMILDHIGKPDIRGGRIEPWRTHLRDLASLPHVLCKLSGVATEADHATWTRDDLKPYIQAAAEAFGPDRLVFGGDWPVSTQAIAYPDWVAVIEWALDGATRTDLRKLFRDNAAAFYRLGP